MSLHNDLRNELKDAMKAKDTVRLSVIRNILSESTNQLVASKRTPQDELADDEVLSVIKRLSKQRLDSIEQYTSAGRDDSAASEQAELEILRSYLPPMMTREEIRPVVRAKLEELHITDPAKSGMVVGIIMKELAGKADGGDVKAVVEEVLTTVS